jgi:uncharacterized phage protein gp47/JayE
MIKPPSVILDGRDQQRILADILARRVGYTPEWLAPAQSAGYGLAAICARYLETIAQRLNQAPDKAKLAFLDLAGLQLIAAQPARAAIVFQLNDKASSGFAPARTAIAAPAPPGSAQSQITFETESDAGVTAGKIVQVFSLWPGRDEYIDHSADFLAGLPIQPFATGQRQPTPHFLYLSHATLLALAGNVELSLEFELTHPADHALEIVWEYFDGQVWRGFLSTTKECGAEAGANADSTAGLTQSGHFILKADCAQAGKTTVSGHEGYWLRGRLTQPLPPDSGQVLPEVDTLRLSSTADRALRGRIRVSESRAPSAPQGTGLNSVLGAPPGGSSAAITGVVRNEAGHPVQGAVVQLIDPGDPTRPAFASQATAADGEYAIPNVSFATAYLYKVIFADIEFSGPEDTLKPKAAPSAAKPVVDLTLLVEGLDPTKCFADGVALDVSKPFYPLAQQPQPGSTFYFSSEETFTKPDAKVRVYLARTNSPQDEGSISDGSTSLSHLLAWEYWNGRQWAALPVTSSDPDSKLDLNRTEVVDFTVPIDMLPVTVNNIEARWVRVRLQSGTYGFKEEVLFQTDTAKSRFTYVVAQPPVLAAFRIGYTWQYGPFFPEQTITYSDFQYHDRSQEAIWPGISFLPFERIGEVTPALYLGFDKAPPAAQLGLFFDITETPEEPVGPALLWEYWDGLEWTRLPAEDETGNLRRPGIVDVLTQSDDAVLDRFGRPLHWIRGRLKEDGPPGEPMMTGIYPNAVWASEQHSIANSPVGTSNGTPNQSFPITQVPILPGEQIEVRELNGARATVEWRILAMEIFDGDATVVDQLEDQLGREGSSSDITYGPLRLRRNRLKQVTEAWVGWQSRSQLFFSGPQDRHYAIDRALGRLTFGDEVNGKVPPSGSAILIRRMTSGGGSSGNVPASAIAQMLGVVPGIQAVFNPRPAEGGADGETNAAALDRGPRTMRHRGRAIEPADYETLAREASPAVAIARAIPGRNPSGVHVPGWVTLIIVPSSQEARPYPSFGLRQDIRRFLESRAPAEVSALHRINVTGPAYLAIDVAATIAPQDASQAGAVENAARDALKRFLHPLFGGPGGNGWELGRDVFLSDIAAELERTAGVDYIRELSLLLGGAPQGEWVTVGEEQMVAAGAITIKLEEPER